MAKKQGLIPDEKAEDTNGDGDEEKKPEAKKAEVLKKPESVDDRWRVLADGKTPEAVISEVAEKGDLGPDQEKVLLASLTQNGKTLYWSQKRERQKRQAAEKSLEEREQKIAEYEKKIKELETKKPSGEMDEDEDPLNLDGAKKDETDPKKKPLTEEDLDRREKERQDRESAEQERRMQRAQVLRETLDAQQEEARERYQDFDDALRGVAGIIGAANEGKLAELYPDPRQRTRIEREVHGLLTAWARADENEPGEYNAADMTYELGKKHPQFGKPTKPSAHAKGDKRGETDADGNPEAVRRAMENASRRGSSASLSGGSRREIAVDELTEEQASKLSESQWAKLPKATRERLLGKPE
jgi:hypothetical protein